MTTFIDNDVVRYLSLVISLNDLKQNVINLFALCMCIKNVCLTPHIYITYD